MKPDDLKQGAVIFATLAYDAAMRDALIPRRAAARADAVSDDQPERRRPQVRRQQPRGRGVLSPRRRHHRGAAGARRIVVVSAMSGVTDALVGVARLAGARRRRVPRRARGDSRAASSRRSPSCFARGRRRAAGRGRDRTRPRRRRATCCAPRRCCDGYSRETLELVSGYGEVWSAQMLAALHRARPAATSAGSTRATC